MARLQHVDDVASLLPLYLEGEALALYMEMKEEDQKDISLIEARLKEAFTEGTFTAYRKLTMVRWAGKRVNVYANKIRQLDGLARFEGAGWRGSQSWLLSQVSLIPFQLSCSKPRISKPWPWENC